MKRVEPDSSEAQTGRLVFAGADQKDVPLNERMGKLKRIAFTDRAQMKKLVDPVMEAYAKEIGADNIFAAINKIQ